MLHIAAYRGDLKEARRLTEAEEHLSPLLRDEYGRNALHDADQRGNKSVLVYFIEERQHNPACLDRNGWNPLHIAANYNHFELVRY